MYATKPLPFLPFKQAITAVKHIYNYIDMCQSHKPTRTHTDKDVTMNSLSELVGSRVVAINLVFEKSGHV